jgi:hypothetical protein
MSKLTVYTKDEFSVLREQAKEFFDSGMIKKCYTNASQVLFAIELGYSVGFTPVVALLNISIINGAPGISADAQLAIARNSGELEFFEEKFEGEGDNLKATCTIKRKGFSAHVREFSVADAKKAKLWGRAGPWVDYSTLTQSRMLQMRARTFCIRDQFGDYLLGLCHSVEELQDMVNVSSTYTIDGKEIAREEVIKCLITKLKAITDQDGFYEYETWKINNEAEFKRWWGDSKGTKDQEDFKACMKEVKSIIAETNKPDTATIPQILTDEYQIDGDLMSVQAIFDLLNEKVSMIDTVEDSVIFDAWKNENTDQLRRWARDNFDDARYKEYLSAYKEATSRVHEHKCKLAEAAAVQHIPDEFQAAYGVEQ